MAFTLANNKVSLAHPPDTSVMDLHNDNASEEKNREDSKGEPSHGSASGSARRGDGIKYYDPEPHGCAHILEQLVAALHEAGLEGDPQCSRKRKRGARHFGRRDTDDSGDSDSGDEEDSKP